MLWFQRRDRGFRIGRRAEPLDEIGVDGINIPSEPFFQDFHIHAALFQRQKQPAYHGRDESLSLLPELMGTLAPFQHGSKRELDTLEHDFSAELGNFGRALDKSNGKLR